MKPIPLFKVFMSETANAEVSKVLSSGYIGQGPKVDKFESLLADYTGNKFINTVNSGTSALHLAVHMTIDGCRDEVLTTPLTCTATNIPITNLGLKIKWVDIDPKTFNVDLSDLRRKLSPKTLAIMVVHWGGCPCDLSELTNIQNHCQELYGFKPPIIEDCAHALGATYKGKILGNHGNLCAYSFQAIKSLTTGDGGMLISPNQQFHERAKLLRWFGLDRTSSADFRCSQNISECGFKFHMNDIAAAIGIENLKHLDWIVQRHQENASLLKDKLQGLDLQEELPDSKSSFWVFSMMVENRTDFVKKMAEKGISASQVHDRNDKHDCWKQFKCPLPNLDKISKKLICIPCGWWVTKQEIEYIADQIRSGW